MDIDVSPTRDTTRRVQYCSKWRRIGNTIYVSASVGCDMMYHQRAPTPREQMELGIANMMAAIQGAGSNKDYIAKLTMYLTRKDNHFDMMMSILAQYFGKPEDVPPWTCLGVSALPQATCFAIECICEFPGQLPPSGTATLSGQNVTNETPNQDYDA
ncbi:predicted protein [Postia placenta Mad-698-R]|nr:predicted protein [Postia placenta Mad-698-R]